MSLLQTLVLPEAVPPVTPIRKGARKAAVMRGAHHRSGLNAVTFEASPSCALQLLVR